MQLSRQQLFMLIFIVLMGVTAVGSLSAQSRHKSFRVVFYNVENLFDTQNDSLTNDDEYTPEGNRAWTDYKYNHKLNNIYKVLAAVGEWDGVDIIGLSEIENRHVLEDLISKTPLSKHPYEIIHRESPDRRGIDVALLFNTNQFTRVAESYRTINYPFDSTRTTREILHTTLLHAGKDTMHFLVNHWPSRWGGEERSRPNRIAAAKNLRNMLDSIFMKDQDANIVIMGDFNDTPQNISIQQYLRAKNEYSSIQDTIIYNVSATLESLSIGTHKYQGHWNILDQVMVSGSLLNPSNSIYTRLDAIKIFQSDFLLTDDERFTGKYPFRTYHGFNWQPGYSDHLPVYIDFFAQ
ncbi:MAG: endonuclease [Bacteroidetes bacterium]|jgi:predicted extracellular nuclease|nr:endonuclease [Bacteroidota bacterium]